MKRLIDDHDGLYPQATDKCIAYHGNTIKGTFGSLGSLVGRQRS